MPLGQLDQELIQMGRKAMYGSGEMAGVTGLEPATSGVTGRRSNQLSYTPMRTRAGGADLIQHHNSVKQS